MRETISDHDPVIIGGARTAIGRLLGSLAGFSAADLGGFAIKGALDRAAIAPDAVEYVIMGHVLQAGTGQITARQAAVKAGIPMSTPATTVNKVCLSGLDAIAQAADLIRLGEFDVIVAGGMESMTNAPHLLKDSRKGYKYGAVEMLDSMALDGLTDAFDGLSMGESTERHNAKLGITREDQDEFAARSQQRAARAAKDGVLGEEIVPVEVKSRKETIDFKTDEGVRPDTTAESLAKLPAAFGKEGTITAGSSSQISDGAAALIVTSRKKAEELGATVLAPEGFAEHGPFDVILELVGAPNMPDNVNALNVLGRIAVIGIGGGAKAEVHLGALMGNRGRIFSSTLRYRPLEEKSYTARAMERSVLPLFERGELTVPIAETFPLGEAEAAYDRFTEGGKLGKIILTM